MKKLMILVSAVLLFTAVTVSAATLETKSSYVRTEGANGLSYGLTYTGSVYEGMDFLKDVSVGVYTDLAAIEGSYNFVAAPIVKASFPLSYIKIGFGMDYAKVAGTGDYAWAFVTGAGVNASITDTAKIGLDYTFVYNINNKTPIHILGPVFMISL